MRRCARIERAKKGYENYALKILELRLKSLIFSCKIITKTHVYIAAGIRNQSRNVIESFAEFS
jgi:hypothetical protein